MDLIFKVITVTGRIITHTQGLKYCAREVYKLYILLFNITQMDASDDSSKEL